MKKLFAISFIAVIMMACGSEQKPETKQEGMEAEKAVMLTVGNFDEKAGELVGKLVTLKGTADHICKHDGKKMFLIDTESEGRVKIVTGEELPAFNSETEGFDYLVTGIISETVVDEAYLLEWEEEIKAGIAEEDKHLGGGEKSTTSAEINAEAEGEDHHSEESAFDAIIQHRKTMAEKGVDKLFFYEVVAVTYEIVEE